MVVRPRSSSARHSRCSMKSVAYSVSARCVSRSAASVRATRAANGRAIAVASAAGAPLIVLWMRTARRHDVVKPRTFLRTLMHELGHYLDYALLKLGDSYHTIGFYQRESFLLRTLCPADSPPPRSK